VRAPAPGGAPGARLLAILIVVASGLAVLPLLFAAFATIGFVSPGAEPATRGLLLIGWLMAALVVVGWNLIFGIRVLQAPSWRGVAWLYLPTVLLLIPAVPVMLRLWGG